MSAVGERVEEDLLEEDLGWVERGGNALSGRWRLCRERKMRVGERGCEEGRGGHMSMTG